MLFIHWIEDEDARGELAGICKTAILQAHKAAQIPWLH